MMIGRSDGRCRIELSEFLHDLNHEKVVTADGKGGPHLLTLSLR